MVCAHLHVVELGRLYVRPSSLVSTAGCAASRYMTSFSSSTLRRSFSSQPRLPLLRMQGLLCLASFAVCSIGIRVVAPLGGRSSGVGHGKRNSDKQGEACTYAVPWLNQRCVMNAATTVNGFFEA